ncbi:MAG: hypothetical protein IJ480_02230 [Clostridia bacterium]|nr:hypothetical protein [Clostridia bacterium]
METRETLQALEEKIHRKHRLEARRRLLQKEERELREGMDIYARQAAEEQWDVEELTGRTLKGFLARLQKNTYQEKLTREQAEAAAALAKYEDAQTRLTEIGVQMQEMTQELRELKMAEREYKSCLEERRQRILAQDSPAAEEMARLEKEAEQIRERKREVDEAVTAGKRVQQLAVQIDKELEDAEGWGNWDAWGNGGLLTDVLKYDHLDKAGSMSQSLQKLLSDFHAELADVAVYADVQVEIDEFTRFADFFWDGIFVDFAVLDKIRSARWKIQELDKELDHVMEDLHRLAAETDRALAVNENAVRRLAAEGDV